MLVLSRKKGESIQIDDNIFVTVSEVKGGTCSSLNRRAAVRARSSSGTAGPRVRSRSGHTRIRYSGPC